MTWFEIIRWVTLGILWLCIIAQGIVLRDNLRLRRQAEANLRESYRILAGCENLRDIKIIMEVPDEGENNN